MLLQLKNNNKYILKNIFCGKWILKIITKICDNIFKKQESMLINTINYNLYERNLIQLFPTSKHLFLFKFKFYQVKIS